MRALQSNRASKVKVCVCLLCGCVYAHICRGFVIYYICKMDHRNRLLWPRSWELPQSAICSLEIPKPVIIWDNHKAWDSKEPVWNFSINSQKIETWRWRGGCDISPQSQEVGARCLGVQQMGFSLKNRIHHLVTFLFLMKIPNKSNWRKQRLIRLVACRHP